MTSVTQVNSSIHFKGAANLGCKRFFCFSNCWGLGELDPCSAQRNLNLNFFKTLWLPHKGIFNV